MAKQSEFNVDMERYLERDTSPGVQVKKSRAKDELNVSDLYPDIDEDSGNIIVIEKDNKAKKIFMEYKRKVLSMLKKEEKEIEDLDFDGDESISEVEEVVEKDVREQIGAAQRFRKFFTNLFSSQEKVEEEGFKQEVEQQSMEEEFEEEQIEEELEENKKLKSWSRRFGEKLGLISDEELPEEEVKVQKLVLYKAKLDKDVKLAVMIADKYLKQLPMGAMDQFERSGDKKNFDEVLKRLKLK